MIVPPAAKPKALNEGQRVALIEIFPALFPTKRFHSCRCFFAAGVVCRIRFSTGEIPACSVPATVLAEDCLLSDLQCLQTQSGPAGEREKRKAGLL